MTYRLHDLRDIVNGAIVGDGNVVITGVGSIAQAKTGDIVFVTQQNMNKIQDCPASAFLVSTDVKGTFDVPVIQVDNPRLEFIHLLHLFSNSASSAEKNVSIGDHSIISPHAFIGNHVVIGNDCFIHPNVSIMDGTIIGDRVIIHPGAVIGADGFGFEWDGEKHVKIPHIGNVIIGDDVEIGANTCIDRGTIHATVIGKGTKLDNLIQVGHNVQIGEHCLIAGTSAIAGSSKIGNHVTLAGGSAVVNNVTIGDHAMILANSMVTKNIPKHAVVSGYIARPHHKQLQQSAMLSRLPGIIDELKHQRRK